MELNAEFSKVVRVNYKDNSWRASPGVGIERKRLDRIDDEVAALFQDAREHVGLDGWSDAASHVLVATDGAKVLVLEGSLSNDQSQIAPRDGLWLTPGSDAKLTSGPNGTRS